jgi:hypothetical protein
MPIHDWTRVSAGTFHAFHNSWITHLQERLNAGLLPAPYYALGEQRAGEITPDLLALRAADEGIEELRWDQASDGASNGLVALADAPPQVQLSQEAVDDLAFYLARQRTIVIRHSSGDRIVALIEIVSPANKHTQQTLEQFADKVIAALHDGIHVLLVDLFPPTRYDPDGIHGYIWHRLLAGTYHAPPEGILTLVSYAAIQPLRAFVERLNAGDSLTAMPLCLTRTHYINVPLEETCQQAWSGVPQRWRRVIEGGATETAPRSK